MYSYLIGYIQSDWVLFSPAHVRRASEYLNIRKVGRCRGNGYFTGRVFNYTIGAALVRPAAPLLNAPIAQRGRRPSRRFPTQRRGPSFRCKSKIPAGRSGNSHQIPARARPRCGNITYIASGVNRGLLCFCDVILPYTPAYLISGGLVFHGAGAVCGDPPFFLISHGLYAASFGFLPPLSPLSPLSPAAATPLPPNIPAPPIDFSRSIRIPPPLPLSEVSLAV